MSYNLLFNEALRLHENGQFDEAEKIYRQILETSPNNAEVLNLLGLIAQAKGLHQQAEELFYFALKQAPQRAPFYYNLAFSFKMDNKPREAIENFEKALHIQPNIKEAYNELGSLYQQTGNLEKAKECWQKALAIDADYAEAKANLINFSGKTDVELIQELENLHVSYPQNALVLFYLVKKLIENSLWSKAESNVSFLQKIAPFSDDAEILWGQILYAQQKYQEAQLHFEKALSLNPNNIEALLKLADNASRREEFKLAEELYRRVLELDRKNFEAHNNYAEMLYKQKRLAEALEEYRQAVILNPQSAEVSNNLGIVLKDLGDFEQAVGLFFNAFSLNPMLDVVALNLFETILLYYRQSPKQALELAEKWNDFAPQNIFAQRLLASLRGNKRAENDKIYTEKLFDNFADNYELVMQAVGLAVPMAMGRVAGYVKGRILDFGCGTGLLGAVLKNAENSLIGVDLSSQMLKIAQTKNVYEDLVHADGVAFLQNHEKFDWVMAADVLVYMADVESFIANTKGAKLCFSTETTTKCPDFQLSESGRYQHNPEYIRSLLAKAGYASITQENIVLRQENGKDVLGIIWKAE